MPNCTNVILSCWIVALAVHACIGYTSIHLEWASICTKNIWPMNGPHLRELDSPQAWVYCFLANAAIATSDLVTCNMLTYAQIFIREAHRHGGASWLEYDRVLRQQAALDPALQWQNLNASLFATTILSARGGPSLSCSLCQEADHQASQCALAYMQAPQTLAPRPLGLTQTLPLVMPGPALGVQPTLQLTQPPQPHAPWPKEGCVARDLGTHLFLVEQGLLRKPGSCQFRHVCARGIPIAYPLPIKALGVTHSLTSPPLPSPPLPLTAAYQPVPASLQYSQWPLQIHRGPPCSGGYGSRDGPSTVLAGLPLLTSGVGITPQLAPRPAVCELHPNGDPAGLPH